ncbi:MAG: hypothetical protein IPP19_06730 [Verrucomicrobia bacterium]|nr:hypothetical protein [Verrucomicrobiota bacterium]
MAPSVVWAHVLAVCALWTSPSRADSVFVVRVLPDFDGETQNFAPGFEANDFHVQVPRRKHVQRIALAGRKLVSERVRIAGFEVVSNYDCVRLGHRALIFQLGGLYLANLESSQVESELGIWQENIHLAHDGFLFADVASGAFYAEVDLIPSGPSAVNLVQLRRFGYDLKSEVLLELPGRTELLPLADGFVVCPPYEDPTGKRTAFRSYTPKGRLQPSELERALNAIYQRSGERLSCPPILCGSFGRGLVYATHLDRPWALVSLAGKGDFDVRPAVLTVGENPLLADIEFPQSGGNKTPINELRMAVVSPAHDLFLATVRESDEVESLWVGVVAREGDRYRARCFRVRGLERIDRLTLSRDGSTIVFATFVGDKWAVGAARVADLVAEINRTQPEAKLDFEALRYRDRR